MTGPSGPQVQHPTAIEVLESFDTGSAEVALAVARGEYLLWLGSGLSKSVVPGVRALLKRLLYFLQEQIDPSDEDCRFKNAVNAIFDVPPIPDEVRDAIDLSSPADSWPLDDLLTRLVPHYSTVLDVRVDGEERDFLVWDGIDIRTTYGAKDLEPDAEHLCVAILMLEGVVRSAQTTNWDGLIEAAVELLAGDNAEAILRVVILQDDFKVPEVRADLLKFHGCAVKAAEDPDQYRHLLIARRTQISGWTTNPNYKVMKERLEHLLTSRPTLIVGLSAQDQNIHTMLHQARENLKHGWPESPPAVVFADTHLSSDHLHTLEATYGDNYDLHKDEIDASALLGAYAKPVLLGLVLFSLADKLCSLIPEPSGLTLGTGDIDRLQRDVRVLRNRITPASGAEELAFVTKFIKTVTFVLSVFRSGSPPDPESTLYEPLSVKPISEARTDPNFPRDALGRFAMAASLISRGIAEEDWAVTVGEATRPTEGVLQITPPDRDESYVFIVQGAAALAQLVTDGRVDMTDPAVLVVRAERAPTRPTRSPMVHYGRTGEPAARELAIETICTQTQTADGLFDAFRLEADL